MGFIFIAIGSHKEGLLHGLKKGKYGKGLRNYQWVMGRSPCLFGG